MGSGGVGWGSGLIRWDQAGSSGVRYRRLGWIRWDKVGSGGVRHCRVCQVGLDGVRWELSLIKWHQVQPGRTRWGPAGSGGVMWVRVGSDGVVRWDGGGTEQYYEYRVGCLALTTARQGVQGGDMLPVFCGELQGLILGPLTFILYVKGIPVLLTFSKPFLYADDTALVSTGTPEGEITSIVCHGILILVVNPAQTCFEC